MIRIFNQDSDSESVAAEKLKTIFTEKWPQFSSEDDRSWINIFVEPFLSGGRVKTSDLVVFGAFEKPIEITKVDGEKLFLKNFFFNVEVKRNRRRHIEIEAGKVKVFYPEDNKWKNATDQAFKQYWAINGHIRTTSAPWIAGSQFINLVNVSDEEIPKDNNGKRLVLNLILNSDNAKDILAVLTSELYTTNTSAEKKETGQGRIISSFYPKDESFFKEASFFPSLTPSFLDQKRMTEIVEGSYRQQWLEEIGKKLLIFQGHGGTGKTIRLLQTAQKLITSEGANCLFLTFNIPLRSTLLRLARLMRIHILQDINEGGIAFDGVMRFCAVIIMYANHKLKLELNTGENFLRELMVKDSNTGKTKYLTALEQFGEYIKALSAEELSDLTKEAYREYEGITFDYDYAFVDECQDWNRIEKDLVLAYFSFNKTICAHGYAQETRGKTLFWTKNLESEKFYAAQLTKAVRMKSNLSKFVKDFSKEAFHENSYRELEINDDGLGGEVHVIEGDYKNFLKFDERGGFTESGYIKGSMAKDGTFPVDYLYCVPDNMAREVVGRKPHQNEYCEVAAILKKNKVGVWDATSGERHNLPKDDEIRIVNYSTCRGLEGWIVFNFAFDDSYNFYIEKYIRDKKESQEIQARSASQIELFDKDELNIDDINVEASNYAAKMSLIALTRGVSEIVIHINDVNSRMGTILKELYERPDYDGVIQWRKL